MTNTPKVRVKTNVPANPELKINSLGVKILLLILAMNFLGYGLLAKGKYYTDSSCSEPTVGVVTEVVNKAVKSKRNKSAATYYAIVKYQANGEMYTYELYNGEYPDQIGKQYNLLYNPEHPQKVALNTGNREFLNVIDMFGNVLLICGGVCFLLIVIPSLITKARKRRAYINDEEYEEAFVKKQNEKHGKNATQNNSADDPYNWTSDQDFRPPVSGESYYDPEVFGKYFEE